MSTGFQGKFHRQNLLSHFAKDLVRRSRSRCELCDRGGVRLEIYELPPPGEAPSVEGCLFVCEACRKQIEHPEKMVPNYWRCLNQAVWSEVPAVQVMSIRLLRRLTAVGQHWAEELLEHTYLDTRIEEWSLQAD